MNKVMSCDKHNKLNQTRYVIHITTYYDLTDARTTISPRPSSFIDNINEKLFTHIILRLSHYAYFVDFYDYFIFVAKLY